ncbi:MAG TPA: hypothetical protein VEK80_11295 [Kribbellaceae bacterium]|nr:hypothetical protein [Kribbellaceae bacterium]
MLATLEDGSARLLALGDDDQLRELAQLPQRPWFAGAARLGDALVLIGDNARALQVGVLGEARAVGSDATDVVAPGLQFTDWTAVGNDRAEGELHGSPVTLSGPLGAGSVTNASFPLYDTDNFSPRLPNSDTVEIVGRTGHSFTVSFGAPVQDVVLQLASCASTITFPPGTAVARISGQPTLTVSGSSIQGVAANPTDVISTTDSNGSVRLCGVFRSLEFSVTPTFLDGTRPDGIYLQIGGLMPADSAGPG